MRKEAFDLLRTAERSWWYKGRSLAIRATAARAGVIAPIDPVLDYGAGFGGMYPELARFGAHVYAFEPETSARSVAKEQGYAGTYSTAADALSNRYGLIGLFDVIEHIEDDKAFLISAGEALAPEGVLVITVPAFQFLWNEHDISHQHFRRYDKVSLTDLLSGAGYEIMAISYWNMLLFIPAAIVRLLGRSGASALEYSGFISSIILRILSIEAKILSAFPLPFGVSLVAVVRKKWIIQGTEKCRHT